MGSEGRLWAALAKVLAQKKEQPGRTAGEDSTADCSEECGIGLEKGQVRRQTAKVH